MERTLIATLGEGILVGPYTLHEDTFYEYFEPYRHPEAHFDIWGGIGLETFGEDMEIVRRTNPEYIWTISSADAGGRNATENAVHCPPRPNPSTGTCDIPPDSAATRFW